MQYGYSRRRLNAGKRAVQANTSRLINNGLVSRNEDGNVLVTQNWLTQLNELVVACGQQGRKAREQLRVDTYRRERIAAQDPWLTKKAEEYNNKTDYFPDAAGLTPLSP